MGKYTFYYRHTGDNYLYTTVTRRDSEEAARAWFKSVFPNTAVVYFDFVKNG